MHARLFIGLMLCVALFSGGDTKAKACGGGRVVLICVVESFMCGVVVLICGGIPIHLH